MKIELEFDNTNDLLDLAQCLNIGCCETSCDNTADENIKIRDYEEEPFILDLNTEPVGIPVEQVIEDTSDDDILEEDFQDTLTDIGSTAIKTFVPEVPGFVADVAAANNAKAVSTAFKTGPLGATGVFEDTEMSDLIGDEYKKKKTPQGGLLTLLGLMDFADDQHEHGCCCGKCHPVDNDNIAPINTSVMDTAVVAEPAITVDVPAIMAESEEQSSIDRQTVFEKDKDLEEDLHDLGTIPQGTEFIDMPNKKAYKTKKDIELSYEDGVNERDKIKINNEINTLLKNPDEDGKAEFTTRYKNLANYAANYLRYELDCLDVTVTENKNGIGYTVTFRN